MSAVPNVSEIPLARIEPVLDQFMAWLQQYGETSWDYQTYFASPLGGWAKGLYYRNRLVGTVAVSPMIFSEAFIPSARRFFAPRLRFPIADAHYAMGFAFLEEARCPGYKHRCWGYPFDWETVTGTVHQGTPLITTTPYVYEAFREVYRLDADVRWREAMACIARHAAEDIKDYPVSKTAWSSSYSPFENKGGVVNASAYRAFLLTCASTDLNEDRYWTIAERNLNFVVEAQRPDGSWYYSVDGIRDFVDHFHTCFVLKALAKIDQLRPTAKAWNAITKGVEYYITNLFSEDALPKPFSKRPRMTVYRRELYDYAECINLSILLRGRFPKLDENLSLVLNDII